MKYIVMIFLIFGMLLAVGCQSEPQKYMLSKEDSKNQRVIERSGLANPATLYCMNTTGASWQTKENSAGEYGVCTFSDSSWCEEWAYYRGECAPGLNMTSCEGYWGKTICPNDYNPVCANVEDGWKNFNNACKACLRSEGNATGYVPGTC